MKMRSPKKDDAEQMKKFATLLTLAGLIMTAPAHANSYNLGYDVYAVVLKRSKPTTYYRASQMII